MPATNAPTILDLTVDRKRNTMTLVLKINPAKTAEDLPLSKSGKTRMVMTTGGVALTGVKHLGRELRIGVNAFVPLIAE